jgi:hypothetical protein
MTNGTDHATVRLLPAGGGKAMDAQGKMTIQVQLVAVVYRVERLRLSETPEPDRSDELARLTERCLGVLNHAEAGLDGQATPTFREALRRAKAEVLGSRA